MASLAWPARFLIEANWSRVKIALECENLLRSYKTGLVLPINFYRTRIKEPVIITRIKSSSNLLIFLVCFVWVVSCWLHASGAFFACCRTCNVLILSQIISACSVSRKVHHLQLKFAFFLWFFLTVDEHLENPTTINLSRFGEFQQGCH